MFSQSSLLGRSFKILFLFCKNFQIFSMRCGICLSVIEKLISSKQGLGKIVWCGLMFVSQLMSGLSSDRCHRHQPIRGEYAGCGPIRGGHLSPTQLAWCEKKLQYLFYIRRKLEELVLLVGRSQDSCGKDCQTLPAEFTPSNTGWGDPLQSAGSRLSSKWRAARNTEQLPQSIPGL